MVLDHREERKHESVRLEVLDRGLLQETIENMSLDSRVCNLVIVGRCLRICLCVSHKLSNEFGAVIMGTESEVRHSFYQWV